MKNPSWDAVVEYYANVLDTPRKTVNHMAVFDILRLSVKGYSNTYISELLQMDKRYVRDVLIEFLKFTGWKNDLDLSPIDVYNRCDGNFTCYAHECTTISSLFDRDSVLISYTICNDFTKIKKGLDDYYDQNRTA